MTYRIDFSIYGQRETLFVHDALCARDARLRFRVQLHDGDKPVGELARIYRIKRVR